MENFKNWFGLIATVGGWCVSLGIYIAKVKQHDRQIDALEKRAAHNEALMQSIATSLAKIENTLQMIVEGKINIGK